MLLGWINLLGKVFMGIKLGQPVAERTTPNNRVSMTDNPHHPVHSSNSRHNSSFGDMLPVSEASRCVCQERQSES